VHILHFDTGPSQLILVTAKYGLKCGSLPEHTRNETEIGTRFSKPGEELPKTEKKRASKEEEQSNCKKLGLIFFPRGYAGIKGQHPNSKEQIPYKPSSHYPPATGTFVGLFADEKAETESLIG
jgi:hypothetical protein